VAAVEDPRGALEPSNITFTRSHRIGGMVCLSARSITRRMFEAAR
jgi:hypothetical protein